MTPMKIVLIDDSSSANLYHKIMMEEAGMNVEKDVKEFISSVECKNYFQNIYDQKLLDQFPDVLLLDINIPILSGWEMVSFLEGLDLGEHTPKVYMVSNSRNPIDLEKAKTHPIVIDILEKHLEVDFFESILSQE